MPSTLEQLDRLRAARAIVNKHKTDWPDKTLWDAAASKLAHGKWSHWLADESPSDELSDDVVAALNRCDEEAEQTGLLTRE